MDSSDFLRIGWIHPSASRLLDLDCESIEARDESLPVDLIHCLSQVSASCAKNTAMYFLLKAALLLFLQAGGQCLEKECTLDPPPSGEIHLIHSRRKYFEAIKYFVLC